MNYVTTNIRISEDDYLKLKAEAAIKRKSLSAIIREKLGSENLSSSDENAKRILENLNKITEKNSKYFKGVDGVTAIREMRHEDV